VPSSLIPSLDGIRALSILLVSIGHFAYNAGFHNWWTDEYAHYGVRTFFVLSGFLITSLLIREQEKTGTINLKQFYIRRAYRVPPAAYAYLAVMTILFYDSLSPRYLRIAYVYLTSYALHSPWSLFHLWSLSVEEQFYLMWPPLVALGVIVARRYALSVIVIGPVIRLLLAIGISWRASRWSFPAVADSLAAGCLLALCQVEIVKWRSFFNWRGFPLIWAFTLSIPVLLHYIQSFHFLHIAGLVEASGLTVFNCGIVLCIQNAISVPPRILNTPGVVWFGNLSYSFYLWQMPFTNPNVQSWATAFPQNLAFAFLAAVISFYAVEQPFLKLREHRTKKSRRTARFAPVFEP